MLEAVDDGEVAARITVPIPKQLDLAHPRALVRYLETDGRVSSELFEVADTTIRNNRVIIVPVGSTRRILVNKRRLVPVTAINAATVVEACDRYTPLCPKCGMEITFVTQGTDVIEAECPEHGVFPLHWLGVKPMALDESNTGTKVAKAPKAPKEKATAAAKAPKEPKAPKPPKEPATRKARAAKEPQAVDMNSIAALGELYTKKHVAFDHAHVTVQAHILLVTLSGGEVRKHCFNTYNGSLGKKAKQQDLSVFQNQDAGFAVKDIEKERATLERANYELQAPGSFASPPPAVITPEQQQEAQAAAAVPEPEQQAEPTAAAPATNGKAPAQPAPKNISVSGAEALEGV